MGKVFRDKAVDVTKCLKYGRYQEGIASSAYTLFDKKSAATDVNVDILAMQEKSATRTRT